MGDEDTRQKLRHGIIIALDDTNGLGVIEDDDGEWIIVLTPVLGIIALLQLSVMVKGGA